MSFRLGFVLSWFFLLPAISASAAPCVIMLHGLSRSQFSMVAIEDALQADGYQVVNQSYHSRSEPIQELSETAIPEAIAECEDKSQIGMVAHSLGAILIRDYYARHLEASHPFAVVMLGPPNKGSEIIDNPNYQNFGGAWWNGPAGDQLSAAPDSYVNQLPPVNYPVGVIAGNQTFNPYYSDILEGEDDGKVRVASTAVQGMSDWIVMSVNHTYMMQNQDVIAQILYFLKNGEFDK